MKVALVYVKAADGRSIGEIANILDASQKWSHRLLSNKIVEKVQIPTALENSPQSQLQTQFVADVGAYWSDGTTSQATQPLVDDGNGNMIGDVSFTFYPFEAAHWEVIENTTEKLTADIMDLYSIMSAEVLAQMTVVFGTSKTDSALSYEATWKEMNAVPSDYSSAGLTARFAVAGFAIGDALNTDLKITDYSAAKIAELKSYAVWRMQRIEQFRTDKAALLA